MLKATGNKNIAYIYGYDLLPQPRRSHDENDGHVATKSRANSRVPEKVVWHRSLFILLIDTGTMLQAHLGFCYTV
jgi:hypothetical protein